MALSDIFVNGKLKSEVRDRILEQLYAAGLSKDKINCYLVGDLVTSRYKSFSPLQVVVCLSDQSAEEFNENIGKYLTAIQFPDLGKHCEYAFINGIINLSDHPAVYELLHGVWFKGEPEEERKGQKTLEEFYSSYEEPQEQSNKTPRIDFGPTPKPTTTQDVALTLNGQDPTEFLKTIKEHFPYFLRVKEITPEEVILTIYPENISALEEILNNYQNYVGREKPKFKTRDWSDLEVEEFFVELPKGVGKANVVEFLNDQKMYRYTIDDYGSKRVRIQCYAQDLPRLKELLKFFLNEEVGEQDPTLSAPEKEKPAPVPKPPPAKKLVKGPNSFLVDLTSVDENQLNRLIAPYVSLFKASRDGNTRMFDVYNPVDKENLLKLLRKNFPSIRLGQSTASPFIKFYKEAERGYDPDQAIVEDCLMILEKYYVEYLAWYQKYKPTRDVENQRVYEAFQKRLMEIKVALGSQDIKRQIIAVDNGINEWHLDYPVVQHLLMEASQDVEEKEEEEKLEADFGVLFDILQKLGRMPKSSPYIREGQSNLVRWDFFWKSEHKDFRKRSWETGHPESAFLYDLPEDMSLEEALAHVTEDTGRTGTFRSGVVEIQNSLGVYHTTDGNRIDPKRGNYTFKSWEDLEREGVKKRAMRLSWEAWWLTPDLKWIKVKGSHLDILISNFFPRDPDVLNYLEKFKEFEEKTKADFATDAEEQEIGELGEALFQKAYAAHYLRVIATSGILFFTGNATNTQKKELKDTAIESGLELEEEVGRRIAAAIPGYEKAWIGTYEHVIVPVLIVVSKEPHQGNVYGPKRISRFVWDKNHWFADTHWNEYLGEPSDQFDRRLVRVLENLKDLKQVSMGEVEEAKDQLLQQYQKRKASAFIQDIKLSDLPKDTQKDICQFIDCHKEISIPMFGIVVSELLPKADPHNLKSALEHIEDVSIKKLEKEVYDKADKKFILIVNDKVIDGHHYLAKASKAGVTRTLRVLDLTACRFQKKIALSNRTHPPIRIAEHTKTICVDLDNTIAKYTEWKGEDHFGEPLPGAEEALRKLKELGWTIIIHTTRGNDKAIQEYMDNNGLLFDFININPEQPEGCSEKPIADIYLDDRAITFTSWDDALKQIQKKKVAQADLRDGFLGFVKEGEVRGKWLKNIPGVGHGEHGRQIGDERFRYFPSNGFVCWTSPPSEEALEAVKEYAAHQGWQVKGFNKDVFDIPDYGNQVERPLRLSNRRAQGSPKTHGVVIADGTWLQMTNSHEDTFQNWIEKVDSKAKSLVEAAYGKANSIDPISESAEEAWGNYFQILIDKYKPIRVWGSSEESSAEAMWGTSITKDQIDTLIERAAERNTPIELIRNDRVFRTLYPPKHIALSNRRNAISEDLLNQLKQHQISYDGIFGGYGKIPEKLQLTDQNEANKSYGTTFYVPVESMIEQILEEYQKVQKRFTLSNRNGQRDWFKAPSIFWIDRSGNIKAAGQGGHVKVAIDILKTKLTPVDYEEIYEEMYNKGYLRGAAITDEECYVNGKEITPAQQKTLNRYAEDSEGVVFFIREGSGKEARPIADFRQASKRTATWLSYWLTPDAKLEKCPDNDHASYIAEKFKVDISSNYLESEKQIEPYHLKGFVRIIIDIDRGAIMYNDAAMKETPSGRLVPDRSTGKKISTAQLQVLRDLAIEKGYTLEDAGYDEPKVIFDPKRQASLSNLNLDNLRIGKSVPGYNTVYMGLTYEGIGILFVTESPVTHQARLNYFLYPGYELSKFEDSHLSGKEWIDQNPPKLEQKYHIDTAPGHDSPTKAEVIEDKGEFDAKIESLASQLDHEIEIPYPRVKDGLADLLDISLRQHTLAYA